MGREQELALAVPLLDTLSRGRGGILWIEGEAGIGKSALAEELIRRAERLGVPSLRGWGEQPLRRVPLRVMPDCLRVPALPGTGAGPESRALSEIAALLGGQSSASGAGDAVSVAAERMFDLVERLCARGPLLLTVENLQWADRLSLQLCNRLAYAVDEIPLLLVAVHRSAPARRSVESLRETVRARGGVFVRPGPLPERVTARIVAQITGSPPGPRLRAELARADGNPLYTREMLDALIGEDSITVRGGIAEFHGTAGAIPGSLARTIRRRFEDLSPQALGVLRTAALLGTEFDAGTGALATGVPASVMAHSIEQAVAAGLLAAAGERLAFRHGLIRQVLAEQCGPEELRRRHNAIARALAAGGAGLEAVARQLMAAPERLDDWALNWLARLPSAALYAAPEIAAGLLAKAVFAARPNESPWGELVARFGEVLLLLGRDAELIEFVSAAAERATDPALAARLKITMVRAAGRCGRPDYAVDVARSALAQPDIGAPLHARLTAWQSVAHTAAGRPEHGYTLAHQALSEARIAHDPLALAYAHHAASLAATTGEGLEPPKHPRPQPLRHPAHRSLTTERKGKDVARTGNKACPRTYAGVCDA